MSTTHTISAELRDRAGKGAARAVRRAGRVPAVIYGDKKDAVLISLEPRELRKQLITGHFLSTVYTVEVAGGKSERVLPREVQFHPVTDIPEHVDLMRVSKSTRAHVQVPCVFLNEEASPGIKRGGVLNVVRHEIEVVCGIDEIPEEIQIDLTGLDIGDSVHISAVNLPKGVKPAIERDFTVATIVAPKLRTEAEEVAAAAGEAEAAEAAEAESSED